MPTDPHPTEGPTVNQCCAWCPFKGCQGCDWQGKPVAAQQQTASDVQAETGRIGYAKRAHSATPGDAPTSTEGLTPPIEEAKG